MTTPLILEVHFPTNAREHTLCTARFSVRAKQPTSVNCSLFLHIMFTALSTVPLFYLVCQFFFSNPCLTKRRGFKNWEWVKPFHHRSHYHSVALLSVLFGHNSFIAKYNGASQFAFLPGSTGGTCVVRALAESDTTALTDSKTSHTINSVIWCHTALNISDLMSNLPYS